VIREDLVIGERRERVHGRLLAPGERTGPCPAGLFVHGWGATQRQTQGLAKQLAALGGIGLTVTLRGHGPSRRRRRTVTRAENLADVRATYDLLRAREDVDTARIGVVGRSYGGYLAVLLSADRPVDWLVLQAPALYEDDGFDRPKAALGAEQDVAGYRRRALPPDANRALRCAARFRGDVLLVESELDVVVPHPTIANYLEAFSGARSVTHHVLRRADHGLAQRGARRAYRAAVRRWWSELLDGAARPRDTAARREA
jgi:hypothetical protein